MTATRECTFISKVVVAYKIQKRKSVAENKRITLFVIYNFGKFLIKAVKL